MGLAEKFPNVLKQLRLYYRSGRYDEFLEEESDVAHFAVQECGAELIKAFLAEARDVLTLDPFPWETITDWNDRGDLDTEEKTRTWLETYIALIEKHLADKPR
jgi:hypothetical protein